MCAARTRPCRERRCRRAPGRDRSWNGSCAARPGLDFKTRTLICVVSDAATGRHPELDIHLRFALKEGWTEDELTEVLLHLTGYVGVPIIREAMLVASKTFADVKKEAGAHQ